LIDNGKNEQVIFDDKQRGFAVRMRSAGKGKLHRSYCAYYKIGRTLRRYTIGDVAKISLEDARRKAKKVFGDVAHDKDPVAEKKAERQAETVGELIAEYLAARKGTLRERSYDEAERHLNILWKPLHALKANKIESRDITSRANKIASESGPVAANRARASLSAMFRWSIGEGSFTRANPVAGTNKQKENDPRERTLSDAEAAAVYLAAPENDYGRIVRLILLTGCRRTELGELQWSEIDTESETITLPKERTKNKQAHVVPLTKRALAILKAVPRVEGRDFVFGTRDSGYSGWSKSKTALDKAAKLKEAWTLHDLRRTVRTGLGKLGVLPHVAEAVLNHLPPKLIRTYDRNKYAAEMRQALELWDNHLAVAVAKANGANVTPLRKA
jgi:integrase